MPRFSFLVLLWISTSISEAKIFTGQIIRGTDTIAVSFKVSLGLFNRQPDLHKLRRKAIYFNELGERKILRARGANEIQIHIGNDTIRMISLANPYSRNRRKPNYCFLKLEEDGALKFFIFYDESTSADGMGTDYTERYLLQKHGSELISIDYFSFRKAILPLIGDCPHLQDKISSREYRRKDLKMIVQYYNNHCQS